MDQLRVDRVMTLLIKQNMEMLGLMRDVRTALMIWGAKEIPRP